MPVAALPISRAIKYRSEMLMIQLQRVLGTSGALYRSIRPASDRERDDRRRYLHSFAAENTNTAAIPSASTLAST